MKQFLLFLSFFFLQSIQAQNFPYDFSVEQGTYTPLTNATPITDSVAWDDIDILAPLGFDFTLFGQTTQTLFQDANFTFNIFGMQADPTPMIISYGTDLIDRGYDSGISQSPITYKVEGAPGSRIFKIQWANAGFYEDQTEAAFTNTQMWIFEGSNDVELHFGPTDLNNQDVFVDNTGPLFGFIDKYDLANDEFDNMWYLSGPVNNPTVKTITFANVDTLYQTVDGAPGDGLIYRFRYMVDIKDPQQFSSQVRVFPSIAANTITIAITDELAGLEKEMQYEIIDPLGKKVQRGLVAGTSTQVDLAGLSGGVYFVNLFSPSGVIATKKIVKQ